MRDKERGGADVASRRGVKLDDRDKFGSMLRGQGFSSLGDLA